MHAQCVANLAFASAIGADVVAPHEVVRGQRAGDDHAVDVVPRDEIALHRVPHAIDDINAYAVVAKVGLSRCIGADIGGGNGIFIPVDQHAMPAELPNIQSFNMVPV